MAMWRQARRFCLACDILKQHDVYEVAFATLAFTALSYCCVYAMVLNGVISSYDQKRRSGFIKETNTGKLYYFAKISVLDHTMRLEAKTSVNFELHALDGKDSVAVRVCPGPKAEIPTLPLETKEHIEVSVVWFNKDKNYGFVRYSDGSSKDAFLHMKSLVKSGIEDVHPGQLLKVRLIPTKGQNSLTAVDVIPVNKPKIKKDIAPKMPYSAPPAPPVSSKESTIIQPRLKTESTCKQNIYDQHNSRLNIQNKNEGCSSNLGTPKKMVQSNIHHHFSPKSNPKEKTGLKLVTQEQYMLQKSIHQKQSLLRTLDLNQLPDGGQRIKDQIVALQLKLQSINTQAPIIAEKAVEPVKVKNPEAYRSSKPIEVVDLTSESHYGISGYGKRADDEFPNTGEFYGGRMTTNRLNLVKKVRYGLIQLQKTNYAVFQYIISV